MDADSLYSGINVADLPSDLPLGYIISLPDLKNLAARRDNELLDFMNQSEFQRFLRQQINFATSFRL